jgi:hypothetical protein
MASGLTRAGQIEIELVSTALAPTPIVGDEEGDQATSAGVDKDPKSINGDVERLQLVLARRGQGVFKYNVRLIESGCRLTGVRDQRHLRASHIKPWNVSSASEKWGFRSFSYTRSDRIRTPIPTFSYTPVRSPLALA